MAEHKESELKTEHEAKTHYFPKNKAYVYGAMGIAALILLLGVFSLGIKVGSHKARFADDWERGYSVNFGAFNAGIMPSGMPMPASFSGHGTFGVILNKDGNVLFLKDNTENEKTVLTSSSTAVKQDFRTLTPADLQIDDPIVVIGSPNQQGQIEA